MFVTTGLNDIKERLSVAYLATVTGRAGYQISHLDLDKQSVDAIVRPVSGRKLSVDFQLKATSTDCVRETDVVFDLPLNNYDDLRDTKCTALYYLMVLVLPKEEESWVHQNEQRLLLNSCAYWLDLRGKEPSSNKETIRVFIPRNQILDAAALVAIMGAADRLTSSGKEGYDARR